jgi:hypothetical protein
MSGAGSSHDVTELLAPDEETSRWLERLAVIGEPDIEVSLPSAEELPRVLLELGVPHQDIDELVTHAPSPTGSPKAWWLLRRCVQELVRTTGDVDRPPAFRPLAENLGALQRYFYVYVFVAMLPHVRAYHRRLEIPDEVSRLTLTELGRNMAVHRSRHGNGGLASAHWLMFTFRGAVHHLGRLQFQRARLDFLRPEVRSRVIASAEAAGVGLTDDDPTLAVHIPAFCGPMTPQACDDAFRRAVPYFARHFPDEPYRIATCGSWLLDDQLADYLPAGSNIVAFQRRFTIAHRPEGSDRTDEDLLRFVFGRSKPDQLDELAPRTTLERAVVAHLKAGRRWRGGVGWLELA